MKEWTIDEFVAECQQLCRNPYTYDYEKMPAGVCNGHRVSPYERSLCSVVIDGCIETLGIINEKYPEGSVFHHIDGKGMNSLDMVRYLLERPKQEKYSDPNVYGFVKGHPVYSRDEFVFKKRGFGAIESDEKLIAFAEKVTYGWSDSGWKQTFLGFYLGDYALDHPKADLTDKEYARLKELQAEARTAAKSADDARCWKLVDKIFWADNSEEEIWEDKDGIRKTVMVVGPHGDAY